MMTLPSAPTGCAGHVMSGVLYQAAGYAQATVEDLRALDEAVLIVSDLFGFVRLSDPIPAYRASMSTRLGSLGTLGTAWRTPLRDIVCAEPDDLFVSCCSTPYQAAWAPTAKACERAGLRILSVRPVVSTPEGLVSISHWAKHYRGRVAAILGPRARDLNTADAVAETIVSAGEADMIDAFIEGSGPLATLTLVIAHES
ncbi:peroxide stress protein YaaA [Nanchangia anserum]|nr:peroxide stress protein YaaA [Nanchangia anserum]QOX81220.1 peroxide stress protein YaaA [Nanchangia anserum]